MTRRNFVALISLCMLIVLGLIGVGVGLFFTHARLEPNIAADAVPQGVHLRIPRVPVPAVNRDKPTSKRDHA